jgi:hypothetical protein
VEESKQLQCSDYDMMLLMSDLGIFFKYEFFMLFQYFFLNFPLFFKLTFGGTNSSV